MCRSWVVALAIGLTLPVHAEEQGPSSPNDAALERLLDTAAAYANRYYEVMSRLTADEHYVQQIEAVRTMSPLPPAGSAPMRSVGGQQRVLESECIVLPVGKPFEWRFYRNVLEVDGRPVNDRAERLVALFDHPTETARRRAEQLAEESARYNISDIGRVLNEPALPLVFLNATYRGSVDFTTEGRDGPVWIVGFTERRRPTLFRHNRTQDNPSSGRFWIEAVTGRIRRTEHVVSPMPLRARFTTSFRDDVRFGIGLPDELREQLSTGPEVTARRVSGVAKYSNYREFKVVAQ